MAITHISTITPSGSTTEIEFTTIAGTYDDLLFIGTMKGQYAAWTPADGASIIQFGEGATYWNSAGYYNYQELYDRYSNSTTLGYQNNYSSAGNSSAINAWPIPGSANDADNPGGWWLFVPGYAVTTNTPGRNWQLFSGCISNSTNTEEIVMLQGGQIDTSDAITKVKFSCGTGNFTTSSKVSLYGISNS